MRAGFDRLDRDLQREDVNFSFGFLAQAWGDWNQTAAPGGLAGDQQNLYLRRIRLLVGGQVAKDVTFVFDTDQPNLGKTPKARNSGFLAQDAFVEWKALNAFRLDGGLMFVTFSRNGLQSPASFYTFDISPLATVSNTSTQSSALRDGGLQARGFFLDNHLQYRTGLFQGERDSNREEFAARRRIPAIGPVRQRRRGHSGLKWRRSRRSIPILPL